jgi:hypothetical protein
LSEFIGNPISSYSQLKQNACIAAISCRSVAGGAE